MLEEAELLQLPLRPQLQLLQAEQMEMAMEMGKCQMEAELLQKTLPIIIVVSVILGLVIGLGMAGDANTDTEKTATSVERKEKVTEIRGTH